MRKLNIFYNSFIKSISSPAYYHDVVKARLSFSLKYLFVFSYFVVLLYTLFFAISAISFLPKLPEIIETTKTRLNDFYPDDLIITVQDGVLSTNQQEPIHFTIPEVEETDIQHIVTIDTQAQAEDYYDYNTLILVTDDVFIYPDDRQKGYSVTPIEEVENMTLSRADYDMFLTGILPLLDMVPAIAPFILAVIILLFPLFGAVFEFMRHIVMVGILSIITLLIALMLGLKLSYTKLFQMGLHAATIPGLLLIVLFFLESSVPLIYTSSFLLWMVIILTRYKEN